MKTRNRFLAVLLTLAMILPMLHIPAAAADPVGTPQYSYAEKGTFERITSYEDIEPGLYVLYGERGANNTGAMSNTLNSGVFSSSTVTFTEGDIVAPSAAIVWELIGIPKDGGGYEGYYLYNEAKRIYAVADKDDSKGFSQSAGIPSSHYVPFVSGDGTDEIKLTSTGNNRWICIYSVDFRTYNGTTYYPLYLYKLDVDSIQPDPADPVTVTPGTDVTVLSGQKIQLDCATPDAEISWNRDGGESWTTYAKDNDATWPVITDADGTIYTKASATGYADCISDAITYRVHDGIPVPTAKPGGGAVRADTKVALSGPYGGEIYYTIAADGSAADPTQPGATKYVEPIEITEAVQLCAATKWGDRWSGIATLDFVIKPPEVFKKIVSAEQLNQSTDGTQYVIASLAKQGGAGYSLFALSVAGISNGNGRIPVSITPETDGTLIDPLEELIWTMKPSETGFVLSNTMGDTALELVAMGGDLRTGETGTVFTVVGDQTNKGGNFGTESGLFQIKTSSSSAVMINDNSGAYRYALYADGNYSAGNNGGYLHLFKLVSDNEPPLSPTPSIPKNSYILGGKPLELSAEDGVDIWYKIDGGSETKYTGAFPLNFAEDAEQVTVTARAKKGDLTSAEGSFTYRRVLEATPISTITQSGTLGSYYLIDAVTTIFFEEDGELYVQDNATLGSGIAVKANGGFPALDFDGKRIAAVGKLQTSGAVRYLLLDSFAIAADIGEGAPIPAPVLSLGEANSNNKYSGMAVTVRPVVVVGADPEEGYEGWYIVKNPAGSQSAYVWMGDWTPPTLNTGDTLAITGLWFPGSSMGDLYPIAITEPTDSAPPQTAPGMPEDLSYLRSGAVIELTAAEDAEIYYTLDGSKPTPHAVDGKTLLYRDGIELNFDADTATIVLRAVAIEPDRPVSPDELEVWYHDALSNANVKELDEGKRVMVEGYVTFSQPDNRIYLQEEQPEPVEDPEETEPPEDEGLVGTGIAAEGNGLYQYVGKTVRVYGGLSVSDDGMYTVYAADGPFAVQVVTPGLAAPEPIGWEDEPVEVEKHQSMLVSIASGEINVVGEDADGFWNYIVTENSDSIPVRSTDRWDVEDGYAITALKGIAWFDDVATILTKSDWVTAEEQAEAGQLTKPRADLLSGTYLDNGATVTLSHSVSTAEFYYTTDGVSVPDPALADSGKTKKTTGEIELLFGDANAINIRAVAVDTSGGLTPSAVAVFTYYKTPTAISIAAAKERSSVVTVRGEVTFSADGNSIAIQDSEAPGSGIVVRRSGVSYGEKLGALVQVTGRIHEDEASGAMVLVPVDAIVTTDPAAAVGAFRVMETTATEPHSPIPLTLDDLFDPSTYEVNLNYQSMLVSLSDVQLSQRGVGTAPTYHFLGADHYIGLYAALPETIAEDGWVSISKSVVWMEGFWPYLHAISPVGGGEAPPEETVIAAWTRDYLISLGRYDVHETGLRADGGSDANIGSALIRVKDADGAGVGYKATISGDNPYIIGSILNGKWYNGEYWEISFKTVGFDDATLRFKTYGTGGSGDGNDCPPTWKVEYSTDGTNYSALDPAVTYEPPRGSTATVNNRNALTVVAALPDALSNLNSTVYVRLIPTEPVTGTSITRNNRLVDVIVIADAEVPPPLEKVATPTAAPASGSYLTDGGTVVLTTTTQGASIRYTTDGTNPSTTVGTPCVTSATVHFPAGQNTVVLKAIAFKSGMISSDVASFTYNRVPAPVSNHASGVVMPDTPISLSVPGVQSAVIRYLLTSTGDVKTTGTIFDSNQPIVLTADTTIRAIASVGGAWSAEVSYAYTVNADAEQVKLVKADPATGAVIAGTATIALSCETANATIRYTTDGSEPNAGSEVYTAPIAADFSAGDRFTIKAYATCTDMIDSAVATFAYTKEAGGTIDPPYIPSSGGPSVVPPPAEPTVPDYIKDVPKGTWYYTVVAQIIGFELMHGDEKGNFDPEGTLTREMFVTVLHRLAGEPKAETAETFLDVVPGEWYADAVAWAVESGITVGDGSGFGVGKPVTRESMVVFLYRYLELTGQLGNITPADLGDFPDADRVSDWAQDAVAWAVEAELLTGMGDGTLSPDGLAQRAQAAAMFVRVIAFLESLK